MYCVCVWPWHIQGPCGLVATFKIPSQFLCDFGITPGWWSSFVAVCVSNRVNPDQTTNWRGMAEWIQLHGIQKKISTPSMWNMHETSRPHTCPGGAFSCACCSTKALPHTCKTSILGSFSILEAAGRFKRLACTRRNYGDGWDGSEQILPSETWGHEGQRFWKLHPPKASQSSPMGGTLFFRFRHQTFPKTPMLPLNWSHTHSLCYKNKGQTSEICMSVSKAITLAGSVRIHQWYGIWAPYSEPSNHSCCSSQLLKEWPFSWGHWSGVWAVSDFYASIQGFTRPNRRKTLHSGFLG